MLSRLFPKFLSNVRGGSVLALWFLLPVLIVKTLMAFNFSGLNPLIDVAEILRTVDGVPLEEFSPEARAVILESAGAWGAALLALCLFAWVVVVRYRSGIAIAISMLLIEQLVRTGAGSAQALAALLADPAVPSPAALINLVMSGLLIVALVFSLVRGPVSHSAQPAENPT